MKAAKTCPTCLKVFYRKACIAHRYKYCSRACRSAQALIHQPLICKECGKTFYPDYRNSHRKTQQYCNQKCMGSAIATLDYSVSFLDRDTAELLDGFMLGDGHITPLNPHLAWSVKHKEFDQYISNCFANYQPTSKTVYRQDERLKDGGNWTNTGNTKCHPDLAKQRERWYHNGSRTKTVPQDVLITPKSVLFWYLGDGYKQKTTPVFATMGFTAIEVDMLIMRLRDIDIKSHTVHQNQIRLEFDSVKTFFNYIGWDSPIKCYDYKFFCLPEIRYCQSSKEVAEEIQITTGKLRYHTSILFPQKKTAVNNSRWWSPAEKEIVKKDLSVKRNNRRRMFYA